MKKVSKFNPTKNLTTVYNPDKSGNLWNIYDITGRFPYVAVFFSCILYKDNLKSDHITHIFWETKNQQNSYIQILINKIITKWYNKNCWFFNKKCKITPKKIGSRRKFHVILSETKDIAPLIKGGWGDLFFTTNPSPLRGTPLIRGEKKENFGSRRKFAKSERQWRFIWIF